MISDTWLASTHAIVFARARRHVDSTGCAKYHERQKGHTLRMKMHPLCDAACEFVFIRVTICPPLLFYTLLGADPQDTSHTRGRCERTAASAVS